MKPKTFEELWAETDGISRMVMDKDSAQLGYLAGLRAFAECVPVEAIEAGAVEVVGVYCTSRSDAVPEQAIKHRAALRTFLREVEEAKR